MNTRLMSPNTVAFRGEWEHFQPNSFGDKLIVVHYTIGVGVVL
jgi:hypothetical protein